jgi:peptide chain release factor 2
MSQLSIEQVEARIAELESLTADTEFWADPEIAQKTMQEISRLRARVEPWNKLIGRIRDTLELAELNDPSFVDELTVEADKIDVQVQQMSLRALLNGPNDSRDAFIGIHAGAGGTDSQDWAAMLERMFMRWAEDNGYKVEVIERSEGEEAGIKSATMVIRGDNAFGYLRSEQGVHRLVRLSPFDSASRRHTSFAKVELWPELDDDIDIEINPNDLRIDTYRAGGAGGQHMQKNDTAVRITHLPTNIVIQCQNERSQAQNRDRAMQILKSRLLELDRQKKEAELAALKGDYVNAEWGNQIRSYVLHPYRLVKDHRTNHETGNTTAVLDGRLSEFMQAYLQMNVAGSSKG